MAKPTDPIAVFDSGVGGISVLRELMALMPNENYLYFGDSANAPYGDRPTEQVRTLTLEAAGQLVNRGIKALVVACNTATSAAIGPLREAYPEEILIGIEPALKLAADRFPGKRIGIMATAVTLREEKLDALLHRFLEDAPIFKISAPGLVALVEAGMANSQEAEELLADILTPYKGLIDVLVLGCTHSPFTDNSIRRVLGENLPLFDGAVITEEETKAALAAADLLYDGPGEVIVENSMPGERMVSLSRRLAGLE